MRSVLSAVALLAALPALAQQPDVVTMDLTEFLQLYESSRNRPKDPEPAPWNFAVSRADYAGDVVMDGDVPTAATFRATYRIEAFSSDPLVRIPLLPLTVAIRDARIAGQPAPIDIENGQYTLLTDRKGPFELTVDFAVDVQTSSGQSGFAFEMPSAGSTTVRLRVPDDESLSFDVANASLQSVETSRGQRTLDATLPSTGSLAVTWQRAAEDADVADDPRVYAEVFTLVGIGDGLVQATSTIDYTILFAGVDTLTARVPDGATLLDVQGTGIRDWSVSDGELRVDLNYAAEGSYPLTLMMERVIGEGSTTTQAPFPVPTGVERSKGFIGVESRGNLEIEAGDATAASPVDVRALPARILGITDQPVLLGYKYLTDNAQLPLVVTAHDEVDVLVTLLDQTQARTMWTRDGRQLTSVTCQVRNNRKQYLRLTMPEGAELWSAAVGGRAVQPARDAEGRALLPLVRSQAQGGALAAFDVEVVYVEDTPPADGSTARFEATLPSADVPSTYVAWTVFVPESAKVKGNKAEGSLRWVERLSNPIPRSDVYTIDTFTPQVQNSAGAQAQTGALGDGATPVPVRLPLQGQPVLFEKLLAVDEVLTVGFDVRKLED